MIYKILRRGTANYLLEILTKIVCALEAAYFGYVADGCLAGEQILFSQVDSLAKYELCGGITILRAE